MCSCWGDHQCGFHELADEAAPTDAEVRGLPDPETGDDGDIAGFGDL